MAELVNYNLEQMLPFFSELKNFVDTDKYKEVVSKRKHFEYKIASKVRDFDTFHRYLEYEIKLNNFIRCFKPTENRELKKEQSILIERILKQITTHFQSQPRAFLLAIQTNQLFQNTNRERVYWNELLLKHGPKEASFYSTAAENFMRKMLKTEEKRQDRKAHRNLIKIMESINFFRKKNKLDKVVSLENDVKEIEQLRKTQMIQTRNCHIQWTREIFFNGFKEFPRDQSLYLEYLQFECNNYYYQTNECDEDSIAVIGDCRKGQIVDIILSKMLGIFTDATFLAKVVDVIDEHASTLSTLASLERMREIVAASATNETKKSMNEEGESMECDTAPMAAKVVAVDHYKHFLATYPDPKYVRAIAPESAEQDFVHYLQALQEKITTGALKKEEEMAKVRTILEWTLNSDDWSRVCINLWWQYYLLEKSCGDLLSPFKVLQAAEKKLTPQLQAHLLFLRSKENRLK